MKINKILIVADDSQCSIKAIQYGFNLARDLGAKAAIMSVVEPLMAIGNVDAGIFPDDALITIKRKTDDFLIRMKTQYAAGVITELMAPVGDVQTNVVLAVKKWEADVIVTGTHGRTGLSKLFKGSVAESIIHHSPVPVFVVPMDK